MSEVKILRAASDLGESDVGKTITWSAGQTDVLLEVLDPPRASGVMLRVGSDDQNRIVRVFASTLIGVEDDDSDLL